MSPEVAELVDKARRSLSAARSLLERGDCDFAASRAYYAMFYMAEAALLTRGQAYRKHSAVIGAFGRELVKGGLLPSRLHESLRRGFDERNVGDYGVSGPYPPQRAQHLLESATEFVEAVEVFLRGDPNPRS